MTSIPAALKMIINERDRDLLDHPDPDEVAAETTQDIIQQLLVDQTGLEIEELLDIPAIVDPLGGAEYIKAVLALREASRTWARSRRRRKGLPPLPPAAPEV
jgi:hypothetical protein